MTERLAATCPHGDNTCPCVDGDPCHYEGADALLCPNPPTTVDGAQFYEPTARFPHGLIAAHCHTEGCDWHVSDGDGEVTGECGLVKLGLPPILDPGDGSPAYYSMSQAKPGLPGWTCGWLRTPLNVGSRYRIKDVI